MKILQMIYETPESPFGFGGAGVRAHEIYKRLKDRHGITLLCMKYPGARDCEINGLQHIFAGTESKNLTKSVLAYTFASANFVRKYGNEFDVIVENFLPSTPFFSKFLTKTPVILQVQGIMEGHSLSKFNPFHSVPMYIVEKFYPGLYDRFIFVSDVTKEKIMLGLNKKVRLCPVITNGIGKEILKVAPEDGNYILFLSRIDIYTKGLDLLIKAFERVISENPGIRLVLAGYEFDRFSALMSECSPQVREKIEYAGFVTGEEKFRLLAGARIFVLPSRHESSPISILEAAACGKAIVTSNIPELDFIRERNLGQTFASGRYESLASVINELLHNKKMRAALGKNARAYAKHFLWDTIALEFEQALQQAAGK